MKKFRLIGRFLFILVIAAAAAWIVHPQGSRIDLTKLKIPFKQDFKVKLGLDLQGGSHLEYRADLKDIADSDKRSALDGIRDVIENRVNSFGVAEPSVYVSGSDKIVVELPGIKDVGDAINQIGETPILEFRLENTSPEIKVGADGAAQVDAESAWKPTGLSGKQVKKATADISGQSLGGGAIVVRLEFDDEGKKLFSDITSQNLNKRLAIFLDGQIISAPEIQSAITDGIAIISGNFTATVAKELAQRLNSGALPVPISLVSQQNVGATLGQESVHKSVAAGLVGMLIIALFMILYYRLPGLLATLALAIYAVISIAVFKIGISITALLVVGIFFFMSLTVSSWFGLFALLGYILLMFLKGLSPVTLTLAGMAGFILSIGMAVDANILIFERLKEELRAGKDISRAIEDGFNRAWLSIRDSNVSSLITTVILYAFGTPSIKGFAVTLGIGIIISMFTAITVTRTFLHLVLNRKLTSHPWLFGVESPRKDTKA